MKKRPLSYAVLAVFVCIFAFYIYSITKNEKSIHSNTHDKIYLGFESKVSTFDPRIIGLDPNSQYIEELRFLPLISFDEGGNIKNMLAQSIMPKSNKSWQIKLKKGILFASGEEITTDDVLATYQAIMNPAFGFPVSPRRGAFKNVTKFEKINGDEIYIELKEPDASFINNLVIGILPQVAVSKALPNDVNDKNYESGPFILKKWSDTELALFKNEKYNLTSQAKVTEVNFKIIPDAGTRYAALIKGDIDIIQNSLDPDKINTIEKEMPKKYHVYKQTKLATTYLGINFRDPKLKNLKVRQALASAIDIKSILQYRLHSDEDPATSMFPQENFYFDKDIPQVPYNPEKARQDLKESGIPLPISLSLKVSSSNKSTLEVAKAIAGNLAAVGFTPKVETLENSIFQEQIRRGISQVWIAPWTGFKDPDHLRFVFASDMVPPNGGNRGAYSNADLDKLFQQGREELVSAKRKEIYDKAQQIIAAEVPYIFLWHGKNLAVVSSSIEGFKLYADGRYWSLIDASKKLSTKD
ncbi:MAG: ABC transporter substrate-binding protein [Bdellovibrionota bacterium]